MDMDMIKFVKNDKFAHFIGLKLVTVEPGYAVVQMEVQPHHLNGVGLVQEVLYSPWQIMPLPQLPTQRAALPLASAPIFHFQDSKG